MDGLDIERFFHLGVWRQVLVEEDDRRDGRKQQRQKLCEGRQWMAFDPSVTSDLLTCKPGHH